jgi:hypothetical protein
MTSLQVRAIPFGRKRRVVAALAACFLTGNLSVSAAPIKRPHPIAHQVPAQIQTFDVYLDGGPSHWQSTQLMKIPQGVPLRSSDGQLLDNRAVDYVMWVRDRHPIHFDRIHPALGGLLEAAQAERGTEFFVFTPKRGKAAEAESIHAMSAFSSTPSVEAQVLLPPNGPRVSPEPSSAIVDSSGITQIFPVSQAAVIEAQQIGSTPPATPAAGTFSSDVARQISSSSALSTTVQAIPELLSQLEAPEPSSVFTSCLLFGSAVSWKCWRNKRLRGEKHAAAQSVG